MIEREKWFLCLAKLCHPSDPDKAARAFKAFAPMLTEFPDSAFCQASLGHCARLFRFLPSYGEFVSALGAWWRENRPTASVERAGEWTALPAPEPAKAPTDAEADHVSSVVAEMVKDLHAQAKEREAKAQKSKAMPAHLPDLELLALYSEMGDAGAVRAAMLRRRLGLAS